MGRLPYISDSGARMMEPRARPNRYVVMPRTSNVLLLMPNVSIIPAMPAEYEVEYMTLQTSAIYSRSFNPHAGFLLLLNWMKAHAQALHGLVAESSKEARTYTEVVEKETIAIIHARYHSGHSLGFPLSPSSSQSTSKAGSDVAFVAMETPVLIRLIASALLLLALEMTAFRPRSPFESLPPAG